MNKLLLVLTLLAALVLAVVAVSAPRIINGTPVNPGEYPEVVNIKTGNASCTASVVGPKVLLTAAHCANTGSSSSFSIAGKSYTAKMTRHPGYPGKDADIALGVISAEVEGAKPISIYSGPVNEGDKIRLLGFGCTQPGGSGGNDGVLRQGVTEVIGFSSYDIVSRLADGAALCYGDSGGPVYTVTRPGRAEQMAVNSKGNIKDTNYTTNLTDSEIRGFLEQFAKDNSVDICGVNSDCSDVPEEKFSLENDAVKVNVESKGTYDLDYLKTYFGYLLSYLEEGGKSTLPQPQGELPPGFCSCNDGNMAACDSHGVGRCDSFKVCSCVE